MINNEFYRHVFCSLSVGFSHSTNVVLSTRSHGVAVRVQGTCGLASFVLKLDNNLMRLIRETN